MIRERRTAAGMSLADLAKVTHYSKGHLSRVENDRDVPSLALIRAIDEALVANGALIAIAPVVARGLPVLSGAAVAASNEEALMMATADETARHGRRIGNSNVEDGQLDRLEVALNHVAVGLMAEPLVPLVLEARQVRDEAFNALEGRQYPRQSRRLYAIGAKACGLLAGVTADRFGLSDVATQHANVAVAAAGLAEDPALLAWARSLQSTIAFWQGRYRTAATIAREARAGLAGGGVEVARLASVEARAWAKLGDRESMNAALDVARAARDEDGPAAGVGVIAYPYSNQLRVAATARLWAGEYDRARTELTEALSLLAQEYDSVAHVAAARADLALAHLQSGELDAAVDVLRPLLDMRPAGNYLAGAARRSVSLVEALRGSRFVASGSARQLVSEIEEFVSAQKSNGAASEAGSTSERPLPR
ncbi:MAG TPA: helix-turn-helix domain-containing protein [Mycobacteriales bacterium]|nr:helix-turn-helix domain-containing protein [Mycobacteriales bacterium]